uniref:dual specificity protein kinase zak2-like isoform X2 n=1 Tax=Erigeron canadensis TaxID=72917 RepID=UPI001CB95CAC|nr:dual specificity protein kinase zak2-like isoform X2 [Erigeron canadensis]
MAESKPSTSNYTSIQWPQPCRQIEYPEILLATENFNESLVIGCGGFGKVYKGNINNGSKLVVAAIKRLDSRSDQGETEFWAEVKMLSKLRHAYLVSLIGYCSYEEEFIIVYEYMPNGTLSDHLHKLGTHLSWLERLRICIGAGRGLDYLHTGTGIEFGVIHRDVKSSNILLNERWAAKVSDFGLSRISPANQPSTYVNTLIKGTFGYLDPDYVATGKLTRKSDVYAFGVLLLEVLCCKRPLDPSLDCGFATWAQDSIREGHFKRIIDYYIKSQISPKCLKKFVQIAQRCLDNHPKHRPTMGEVVVGLESILILQEKIDNSLQTSGKTLFGRMVDKFPFPSNPENSDILISSKRLSNNTKEDIQLPTFSYHMIATATDSFSLNNLLGEGGFGNVYKGVLEEGLEIAVKHLSMTSKQGIEELKNEVFLLSRLEHINLVKLLGSCIEGGENLAIYEYMPNKSLDTLLFGGENKRMLLDWERRFNIIKGIAQGLLYLHHGSLISIIHRDLKVNNILLDLNMNPKISDFGLARSLKENQRQAETISVVGTFGYMPPEYAQHGIFSTKSDVYSFGVLVLEIVSGKRNRGFSSHHDYYDLTRDVWLAYNKGMSAKIVDATLAYHPPEVLRSIIVGLLCVQDNAADRPDMTTVVQMLDHEEVDVSMPQTFSYHTIVTATARFSRKNLLGEGGFGKVYKGVLKEGLEIAVKCLSETSRQGIVEFNNEVFFLSRLQHINLVKLIGSCIEGDKKLLIYEYMPNKSLDKFIYGDDNPRLLVDWTRRFNIIKGIAQGLLYLHHGLLTSIIHRDLKLTNILLDLNMNPKISDFGLARHLEENQSEATMSNIAGTLAYMPPEYAFHGNISTKSDVYSFGVLVLEIIFGKRNNFHDLSRDVWRAYNSGVSEELIDETLAESYDQFQVLRSIEVGLLCIQNDARDRPDMTTVVQMLDNTDVLPQPKEPAFFVGRELCPRFSYDISINDLTITQEVR